MSEIKYIRLNGEAIRSIFDGRKSQMRFALKSQDITEDMFLGILTDATPPNHDSACGKDAIELPYEIGDMIGVRETWTILNGEYVYRVDDEMPEGWHLTAWRPSTQMPKEAVRLFLKVKTIRVEKLQDISLEDISNEGIWIPGTLLPQMEFAADWDRSLSDKKREKYGWNQNPWVIVVDFERQVINNAVS